MYIYIKKSLGVKKKKKKINLVTFIHSIFLEKYPKVERPAFAGKMNLAEECRSELL